VKLQVQIKLLNAFVGVKRPAGKNELSLLRTLFIKLLLPASKTPTVIEGVNIIMAE